MMAKRKNDDVEEEDSISDDQLNQHYDELEKQQHGGEISDDHELYDQLNQQQLDALNIDSMNCMINWTNNNWMNNNWMPSI